MAEVFGLVAGGVTIAGLAKLCLEVFDVIQVSRKQGFDCKKLSLRLNIERARLYIWAEQMGLTRIEAANGAGRLHESPFQPLVEEALSLIIKLFRDGNRLQSVYGCEVYHEHLDRKRPLEIGTVDASERFAERFSGFRIGQSVPKTRASCESRMRWIIDDRKKFSDLVQEVRDMVDRLQDITYFLSTRSQQEAMMQHSVEQIKDAETLGLVSGVCRNDYPNLSDAASVRMDALTNDTERQAINHWALNVEDGHDIEEDHDLESLTITELKELVRRRREDSESLQRLRTHSHTLLTDNDRLKRELQRLATQNEILRATSGNAYAFNDYVTQGPERWPRPFPSKDISPPHSIFSYSTLSGAESSATSSSRRHMGAYTEPQSY